MYFMVDKGLVDVFLRNIIEVYCDFIWYFEKVIILEKYYFFFYFNYEYFFVKFDNIVLVNRFCVGLIRVFEFGEFEIIFNWFDVYCKV